MNWNVWKSFPSGQWCDVLWQTVSNIQAAAGKAGPLMMKQLIRGWGRQLVLTKLTGLRGRWAHQCTTTNYSVKRYWNGWGQECPTTASVTWSAVDWCMLNISWTTAFRTDQPPLTHIIHALSSSVTLHVPINPSMGHSRALRASVAPLPRDWNHRSGRPHHTWLQTSESDLTPLNIGLATAYHRVQNHQDWSTLIGMATSITGQATRWWWWWFRTDVSGRLEGNQNIIATDHQQDDDKYIYWHIYCTRQGHVSCKWDSVVSKHPSVQLLYTKKCRWYSWTANLLSCTVVVMYQFVLGSLCRQLS